jgi:SAM-dependent methyltransferase
MSTIVYGDAYAGEYDQLYRDKNYAAECDLVEAALHRYGIGETRTIVDLGCGTGGHAIPLSARGYKVTGVDLSPAMLAVARRKAVSQGTSLDLVEGDIRTVHAGGPFDAGLFMFAVLGYLQRNDDVVAALTTARRQIRAGGLLAFDVWYGPAVLTIKPSDRVKVVAEPHGKVVRVVTPTLDTRRHLCQVHYQLWRFKDGHVDSESEEVHVVRYFFPLELELMLSQTGFTLLTLSSFPTLDEPAGDTTWSVFGIARAV